MTDGSSWFLFVVHEKISYNFFLFLTCAHSKTKKKRTTEKQGIPQVQRYDFWYLARAPGPPNFFGSHRRGSATSNVRSY
jgi:hypothetical protein